MIRPRCKMLCCKSLLFLVSAISARDVFAQVNFARLVNSSREPQNWLTYSGDYAGRRFSTLDQINAANVHSLAAKWVYQTGATGKFETTPLVVDGILYGTAPDDRAFALDARTGRPLWLYQRQLPSDVRPCCGRVNVDYTQGYSFTLAPLAVKNLIILGISGGEYGIRGFIDAYDAETGQRKWRFYTVPGPGEPGHETWQGDSWKTGGAPAWITGAYDPSTNQLFWPTGNPSPSNRGEGRAGDNLYSNTLLALDADTGNLSWHFQFTRHDEHDWDATEIPILIDLREKHLIAQANRNGFFYVLDRTRGKLLSATPFGKVTWSESKDGEGRPVAIKGSSPTPEGQLVCPGAAGTTNWMSPSFDPQTGLFYVNAREQCDAFSTAPQPYEAGHAYYGSAYFPSADSEPYYGALRALDPATGQIKWEFRHPSPSWSGVLSTAGNLVFTGDAEGNFIALDAASGKALWHFQTGGSVHSAPISFAVDGKQYVAVAAGSALYTFGLP